MEHIIADANVVYENELLMKVERATIIDSVRRLRNESKLGFWCLTP